MTARFITFEGIEGSGKSAVASAVHAALAAAGIPSILTREPGGTAVSEEIRRILLDPSRSEIAPGAELLMYLASRAQLVAEIVKPALAAGRSVVCDRFMDASVAYQGWARGLGEDRVRDLNAFAIDGAVPDRTFVLDLPVDEGFRRGPERRRESGAAQPDRLEREARSFHERVREGYLRLARREPGRIVVIDAALPLDEVVRRILGNLAPLFSVDDTWSR